jgi:hypothetical protein
MDRKGKELSIADVAGWGSALATFGLIQGALYLQAYWGRFGLDPFQFVAVSELALAGLAGIGFVLGLMLFASLLGGWLESTLSSIKPERKVLRFVAPLSLLIAVGALLWWANAWVFLGGAFLTLVCVVAVTLSPVVPPSVKDSPWLIYVVLMLVYVSIASNHMGAQRAQKIMRGEARYVSIVRIDSETLNGLNLVGRLGDTYALWDQSRKTTILLPAEDVKKLEILQKISAVATKSAASSTADAPPSPGS